MNWKQYIEWAMTCRSNPLSAERAVEIAVKNTNIDKEEAMEYALHVERGIELEQASIEL